MDLVPVNRCHHLGLAKAPHEISAVPHQVIRDPRQYYQAGCIQID